MIFNHTNKEGFFLFAEYPAGSFEFILNLGNTILCKTGAPLFLMISGALLIPKCEEIQIVYSRRIPKYIITIAAASIFYAFSCTYFGYAKYTLQSFLERLYSSELEFHLWFLYAYIGFLVLLPLHRKIYRGLDNKSYQYLILLCASFSTIQIVDYFLFDGQLRINGNLNPGLPMNSMVLPILGVYASRVRITKRRMSILWLVALTMIGMCIISTYKKGLSDGVFSEGSTQTYLSNYSYFLAYVVFLQIRRLFEERKMPLSIEKVLLSLGECCFGIYLVHPFFKNLINSTEILPMLHSLSIPRNIVGCIFVLCMFCLSYMVTWIFRSIERVFGSSLRKMISLLIGHNDDS